MHNLTGTDLIEADIYTSSERKWFIFGDRVVGNVVLRLKTSKVIGKVIAQLRCIAITRSPPDSRSISSEFFIKTNEVYDSQIITVADLGDHKVAANVHQYPISFTIPSDIEDLPTPYDDWCSFKGKKKWLV